jgi:hypothetical protein
VERALICGGIAVAAFAAPIAMLFLGGRPPRSLRRPRRSQSYRESQSSVPSPSIFNTSSPPTIAGGLDVPGVRSRGSSWRTSFIATDFAPHPRSTPSPTATRETPAHLPTIKLRVPARPNLSIFLVSNPTNRSQSTPNPPKNLIPHLVARPAPATPSATAKADGPTRSSTTGTRTSTGETRGDGSSWPNTSRTRLSTAFEAC